LKKQQKKLSALLAVFPTRESFLKFSSDQDNAPVVRSFIDYATANDLIAEGNVSSLEALISRHERPPEDCTPPAHLSFQALMDNREQWLKIRLSARSLAERINTLLDDNRIALLRLSNPMLTRLKTKPADTVSKQLALRSLAFWLGHERTELGPGWNYETLVKLCPVNKPAEHYQAGVRIGFALSSRGDVIDHAVMNSLKTAIRDYMEKSTGTTLPASWGKVRSHDFTTLYVDIPKEEGLADPASYRSCLTMAVSLAHRVSIRWALSRYCTRNRFLSIGIVAGSFTSLDNYLLPLLTAKLYGDPVIRVSDYVHQCIMINDIRVSFCRQPSETTLFNGEAFSIWWIVAFWGFMYFDFIPDLLEERILKNNPSSEKTLSQLLWFPEEAALRNSEEGKPDAITTFFMFPHNSLLGVEIAKTLFYRRRFQEAIEILRLVLSIDPTDPTARTMRMILFRELALNAPSFFISCQFLAQAEQEALFIQENREVKFEDFYCEYASLFLTKALMTVRNLRSGRGGQDGMPETAAARRSVFDDLAQAERLFERAITVSPWAIRSTYSLNTTRILSAILRDDEEILTNPAKPLNGRPETVVRPGSGFQWQLSLIKSGVVPDDNPTLRNRDFIEKMLVKRFRLHDESIALPAYRANAHYCHAVALWDFFPTRTVGVLKRVSKMLQSARDIAEGAAREDICIYSSTRAHSEMMPAETFIGHITRCMRMVEAIAGKGLAARDDREAVPTADGEVFPILLTLNFS